MNKIVKLNAGILTAFLLLQNVLWGQDTASAELSTSITGVQAVGAGVQSTKGLISLKGTVNGNLPIHMWIKIAEGGKLSGSYYYDKYKKTINLTGSVNGSYAEFSEVDAKGSITGSFEGWWLPDTGFIGAWVSPDRDKQLPVQALTSSAAGIQAPTAADWSGKWSSVKQTAFSGASVEIKKVTKNKLTFTIDAYDGAHTGLVEQKEALIQNRMVTYKPEDGSIVMLYLAPGKKLYVVSPYPVTDAGAGVTFTGEYYKGPAKTIKSTLKDLGVFKSAAEDNAFRKIVANDYGLFTSCMQLLSAEEDLDGYNAEVTSGGIRGLFTLREAIIMHDSKGNYWAAVINDDEVLFYTNVPKTTKLPKTIDAWRQRFSEYKVVFKSK
ncbi:hypothetical protein [Paenibacillus sp. BAC0078]